MTPKGPFDLARSREFFGGWPSPPSDAEAIVMAFSGRRVADLGRGRRQSAARRPHRRRYLRRRCGRRESLASGARDAVTRCRWPKLRGTRSPRHGDPRAPETGRLDAPDPLQFAVRGRDTLVLSHRRSIAQSRATRAALALEHGDRIEIEGRTFHAFPRPQVVRKLRAARGLDAERLVRLRGIADAALDGTLDRRRLRRLSVERALTEIRGLRGIGAFFAQGILFRGAGIVDDITNDEQLRLPVQRAYGMSAPPDSAEVERIAERWRPYRMWAEVLLVLQLFREGGRHGLVSRPRGGRRNVDA